METCMINGNMIKICVLLCIINGVIISALRDYRNPEGTAQRQSVSCDWSQKSVPSTNCSCIKQTMSCVYDIPKSVPMSITTVIVRKYLGEDYHEGLFSDESWRHVEELAIDTSEDMYFHDNSFTGLSKLQTLTLTGMGHLISFADIFLDNDSVPNLKALTVNPGAQQAKPEILLNEERFTGLLKRPLKHLNFSNVLLVTVEDQLLELAVLLKVLNFSDTTVVAYPSAHRTQTQAHKGRDRQPTKDKINHTGQQKKYFHSKVYSLLDGIAKDITRTPTGRVEAKSEHITDAKRTQEINKSFKLKTNISNENILNIKRFRQNGKRHILDVNIHSKRVTDMDQLHPWLTTGFLSSTTKEVYGPTLYILDMSGAEISYAPGSKTVFTAHDNTHSKTRIFEPLPYLFWTTVEHVFSNRLSKVDVIFTQNVNATGIPIYTKTITGRNNRLVVLNFTLTTDNNIPVVFLDLSYNKLQYIAKTAFWCFKNLQRWNLSWNELYKMQRYPDFGKLFMNLTKLQYLNLAHNSLSFLHRNMFKWNKQLEVLLLNNNELSSIGIDLKGLQSLQTLDFSNNKIKSFSNEQIEELSSYFDSRILPNKSINFQFILHGNPLQCVCKSKKLLKMILHYPKFVYNTDSEPLTCSYQGQEITISKDALDKADYLCKRVMIIMTSTIATTVTSAVIGILVVVWWRRRKRRQKQDLLGWFVREFLNGTFRETHLAFIAMSGNEDDRGLMQYVATHLHALAKKSLNTQNKLILTGYDFTPGFPIVNEAYRMIKASCIVLAFISKSFCQSKYCMMELQEACKQDKPLILIFTEHIDEDMMTPYMLEVFKRYARARLEQMEDGEWVMSPSVDKLCEAMIVLASDQYKHDF